MGNVVQKRQGQESSNFVGPGTDVKEIIKALKVTDYVEGPKKDTLNGGPDLWVFGKLIKSKEIYIKVTIGFFNAQAVCISFHTAEFPLHFPFKQ